GVERHPELPDVGARVARGVLRRVQQVPADAELDLDALDVEGADAGLEHTGEALVGHDIPARDGSCRRGGCGEGREDGEKHEDAGGGHGLLPFGNRCGRDAMVASAVGYRSALSNGDLAWRR